MELRPQRRRLHHRAPGWVNRSALFFITVCTQPRGREQLTSSNAFAVLRSALEHNVACGKLWVPLFLAMPDHCHFLASFPGDDEMAKVIKDWKRFTAKHAPIVWQDGFFEHRLRSHESREAKERYILENPCRLVWSRTLNCGRGFGRRRLPRTSRRIKDNPPYPLQSAQGKADYP
jgi:REP element-mobilizing transposase RayT